MSKLNFLFLVILAVITLTNGKHITKRHSSLISRFTSNPFILNSFKYGVGSNFFGNRHVQSYHPVRYHINHRNVEYRPRYWNIRPWKKVTTEEPQKIHHYPATDSSYEANEENQKKYHYPAADYTHEDKSEENEKKLETPTQDCETLSENEYTVSEEPERFDFNNLPLFEQTHPFATDEDIAKKQTFFEENSANNHNEDNEDVGPLFNSLPQFDVRIAFGTPVWDEKSEIEEFTSSPQFEETSRINEENIEKNDGNEDNEAPFTSLERVGNENKEEKKNEETLVKFKDLPHFQVPNNFRVSTNNERFGANTNEGFGSFQEKQSESDVIDEAPFTTFERVNKEIEEEKRKEEKLSIESQQPEIVEEKKNFIPRKNKTGLPNSNQVQFSSLPNFDRFSVFRRPGDRSFFFPEHFGGFFGRRLRPKFRNIGELPLQHSTSATLINSYGKKL